MTEHPPVLLPRVPDHAVVSRFDKWAIAILTAMCSVMIALSVAVFHDWIAAIPYAVIITYWLTIPRLKEHAYRIGYHEARIMMWESLTAARLNGYAYAEWAEANVANAEAFLAKRTPRTHKK